LGRLSSSEQKDQKSKNESLVFTSLRIDWRRSCRYWSVSAAAPDSLKADIGKNFV
ncbi:unnamed protein product, partial [Allacma fusca]